MIRRRNDAEREHWVKNDPDLRAAWDKSNLPLNQFVDINRVDIDRVVDATLDQASGRTPF